MKKTITLSIALLMLITISKAQTNVTLNINHKLANANFAFNQTAQNNLSQSLQITRVDYYISGISIIHDGGMLMAVPNKYILAKGNSNVSASLGSFNVTNVEGIKFSIGVEAPINNADPSMQPAGSPLAAQNPSMHWGWTSGYRFVALEGKTGSGFTTIFQMHSLGNSNYFQQTVMAAGVVAGSNVSINLDADYTQALKNISISAGPIDHGVNATDLTVLQNFRDFVFSPSSLTSSIQNVQASLNFSVFPNPSNGKFVVDYKGNNLKGSEIIVMDAYGKIVAQYPLTVNNEIDLSKEAKGIYFLQIKNNNGSIANRKIIIE